LIFHPPIDPDAFGDRDQLMAAVRAQIASVLPEENRDGAADSGQVAERI
jgi:hypothetical protein